MDHDPAIGSRTAGFESDDVARPLAEDFVARICVDADGYLIAHRAARKEHRGFLTEKIGDALLQRNCGRVLKPLLVSHLGSEHCVEHVRGRPGLGVGVKVVHRRHDRTCAVVSRARPREHSTLDGRGSRPGMTRAKG